MQRRQIIGHLGNITLALVAAHFPLNAQVIVTGKFLFVEAEQFASQGGWDLDQQSLEQM